MPLFEMGHKKLGGREKGTGNKATPIVREMLTKITNEDAFWEKFTTELFALEGRDFTHAAKEMFDFLAPKLQAIAADVTTEGETSPILDRLRQLSELAEE